MIDAASLEGFRTVSLAAIADALDEITGARGFMDSAIVPRVHGHRIVGPAATVMTAPTGERALHNAAMQVIDEAVPGSVIVLGVEDERNAAVWDGVCSSAAAARGLAGAVTDGALRDVGRIRAVGGFEAFAAAVTPAAGLGRIKTLVGNVEIECGGLTVQPGDLVVGDTDGVVVVPQGKASQVLALARRIDRQIDDLFAAAAETRSIRHAMQRHWPLKPS